MQIDNPMATVRAAVATEAIILDGARFKEVVARHPQLRAELKRESARLALVKQQIKALEAAFGELLRHEYQLATASKGLHTKMKRLQESMVWLMSRDRM